LQMRISYSGLPNRVICAIPLQGRLLWIQTQKSFVLQLTPEIEESCLGDACLLCGGLRHSSLVLGFLNKVSNILLELTAVTRYLIPLERGTQDAAHKPVYYHTFFE
jgi:hypothetical protein